MKKAAPCKRAAFFLLQTIPAGYLIREVKLTLPVLFGEV